MAESSSNATNFQLDDENGRIFQGTLIIFNYFYIELKRFVKKSLVIKASIFDVLNILMLMDMNAVMISRCF